MRLNKTSYAASKSIFQPVDGNSGSQIDITQEAVTPNTLNINENVSESSLNYSSVIPEREFDFRSTLVKFKNLDASDREKASQQGHKNAPQNTLIAGLKIKRCDAPITLIEETVLAPELIFESKLHMTVTPTKKQKDSEEKASIGGLNNCLEKSNTPEPTVKESQHQKTSQDENIVIIEKVLKELHQNIDVTHKETIDEILNDLNLEKIEEAFVPEDQLYEDLDDLLSSSTELVIYIDL